MNTPKPDAKHSLTRRVLFWLLAALVFLNLVPCVVAQTPAPKAQPDAILKIIHGWPDAAKDQDQLITNLLRQGFAGVVCNVSFRDYLESEPAWNAFQRAVDRARQSGMELWLYDESGYPSGTAGHLVLKDHPEWEAEGLLSLWEQTDGREVSLKLPPGTPVLAAAFPTISGKIQLAGKMDLSGAITNGSLTWKPTLPGQWLVMVITRSYLYDGTHAELNLAEKRPYLNLLSPEPTARFIDVTHRQYAAHLGTNFPGAFVSTFTDEPSLMSLFLRLMPYRPLPWSPAFSAEFKRRRGYSIEPFLPLLIVDGSEKTAKTRYDFWKTVGELVSENYCGQLLSWCREHHLHSGGHLLMEESLTAQVGLYGDFSSCLRTLDAPGIDCLTSIPAEVPWQIARQASGAADLNANTNVMCETSDHSQRYRPKGDTRPVRRVSEAEIRGTCNKLMVSGINRITSYYSFDGLDDEALHRINSWVAAVCSSIRGGVHAADIALLYPVESLWPRYVPSRHWANEAAEAQRVENSYHSAAQSLFDNGTDFAVIDSRSICDSTLDQAFLCHGDLRWRVIVLPRADTMPAAAWKKLADWVAQGGTVIALGYLPANSQTDFPRPSAQALVGSVFKNSTTEMTVQTNTSGGAGIFLPQNMEWLLPRVIDSLRKPQITISPNSSSIKYTHRHFGGKDRIFVINDDKRPWEGAISLPNAANLVRINLGTGKKMAISDPSAIKIQFGEYDGLIFESDPLTPATANASKTTRFPSLTSEKIPSVEPVIGRGEFVREKFAVDPERSHDGLKAWNASAEITKSQVDVFLFASFRYSTPLDLTKAAAIQFETWVPEGQRAATQLLLIVHKKGGGDYLASTGRSLATPRNEKVVIPLSVFQLAGWSSDPDGHMDWSKVEEIRVGWGGYFGNQGEKVEFQFTEPQLTHLSE